MIYLYRRNKTGICIDRVFGNDGIVEVPEMLEGLLVTELGAYVFSDHMDRNDLERCKLSGCFWADNGQRVMDEEGMPEISGNVVKELILPEHLRKIGRYAFYNCFSLKKISFGGELRDIGAGALTGCHRIERISVKTDENGDSSLRDILTELPETLRVDMNRNGLQGRFWFPEFFEEGVENTPARILENHVHGSGIRYRNSFLHKKLNILEYDRLFPYAEAWEEEEIVLKMALDRLLYPMDLADTAENKYIDYLREHGEHAVSVLGGQKEYEAMRMILAKITPNREQTEKMLERAQRSGDSRWVSILMDRLQSHGRKKRKAFEL